MTAETAARVPLVVKVAREPGSEDLPLPAYMSSSASGLDLPAANREPLEIPPGGRVTVPTGLRLEIPPGYEGQIRPRSGLADRFGVTVLNSPGTVDSDYRGEIKVILVNLGPDTFVVRRGDRVAQLVVAPVARVELVAAEKSGLSPSGRGEGGFGHTGGTGPAPAGTGSAPAGPGT